MPLHVSDAPHRLDLRNLGSKLGAVLVLPLLKQVLVASVSWVLIAYPAGAAEAQQRGKVDVRYEAMDYMRHPFIGGTYVPLCTRTEETFSW